MLQKTYLFQGPSVRAFHLISIPVKMITLITSLRQYAAAVTLFSKASCLLHLLPLIVLPLQSRSNGSNPALRVGDGRAGPDAVSRRAR